MTDYCNNKTEENLKRAWNMFLEIHFPKKHKKHTNDEFLSERIGE